MTKDIEVQNFNRKILEDDAQGTDEKSTRRGSVEVRPSEKLQITTPKNMITEGFNNSSSSDTDEEDVEMLFSMQFVRLMSTNKKIKKMQTAIPNDRYKSKNLTHRSGEDKTITEVSGEDS